MRLRLLLLSLSPLANDKVTVHHLVTRSAALLDASGLTVFYRVPPERTSDAYCSNTKQCYAPCCTKLLPWLGVTLGSAASRGTLLRINTLMIHPTVARFTGRSQL